MSVLTVHIFDQCLNGHGGLHIAHSNVRVAPEVEYLARGVQLFFVISGYVLGVPFLKHHQNGHPAVPLRNFYKRRLTRLEPPYLLSLLLYAGAFIVLRHRAVGSTLLSALYSAFYIHNFLPQPGTVNNVTWTLEIEVEFYLLTPLLALLFAIPNKFLRRAVMLTAAAGTVVLASRISFGGFFLPGQLVFFLVGFLLADLKVFQQNAHSRVWDFAGLALWSAVFLLPASLGTAPLAAALAAAFAASLKSPTIRKLLASKPIATIGGMCYSIYLLHMLTLEACFPLTRHTMIFDNIWLNVATQMALLIPIVLAVSLVYYLIIERPCMDPHWPKHLKQRLRLVTLR